MYVHRPQTNRRGMGDDDPNSSVQLHFFGETPPGQTDPSIAAAAIAYRDQLLADSIPTTYWVIGAIVAALVLMRPGGRR